MSGPAGTQLAPKRTMRAWLLASVLVPLLLFAGAALYDREVVLSRAQERVASIAEALAGHAEAVLETASLALSLELDAAKSMDWPAIGSSAALHRYLLELADQLPPVESVFFVDPDGFNSNSSRAFPMPRFDVRDREYYTAARDGQTGTVVSAPFRGRAQGDLGFTVSRARLANGKFDGVAAVTLSPAYFRNLYRTVLRLPDGSAALLVRSDGMVLARYPGEADGPVRLPSDSPLMRGAAHRRDGLYEAMSPDGKPKLYAVRWLPGRDLMVVAEVDRAAALSEWYLHLVLFAGFALIAALALCLTAGMALRSAAQEQANLQALVTETRRRQEAEAALQQAQKLDALGRLTGGVAHDFNNLLTAVLGSLELALRRISDPKLERLLKAAVSAAQRGAKLTAQMLAFSRKQALALEPIEANDVVRGLDELLRHSVGALVRMDYELRPGLWPVLADRVQLEVALLNLVVNAQDAMPVGGELTLATRNVPAPDAERLGLARRDHVAIAVRDTGQGMTDMVRASAFEPFFTTKEPGKGTGLGLSMVYGFARQADGSVTIDTAVGRGTTVTIYLPRAAETAPGDAEAEAEPPRLDGLRILLVDDEAAAREPTALLLRELGGLVSEADGSASALERLQGAEPVDVLLVDFAMPEMDGGRLTERARELRPNLPVVCLTGYTGADALGRLEALGVGLVRKPFRLPVLAAALHRALENAGA